MEQAQLNPSRVATITKTKPAGSIDEPVWAHGMCWCEVDRVIVMLLVGRAARWLQDDSTLHPKFCGYRLKAP